MTTIIRLPLLAILCIAVITGCNNNEQPVTTLDNMPAKEKELRDAIAQYPDSTPLRLNLVNYLDENGNTDIALSEINKAIAADSLTASLYDMKALLHMEKKDTSAAIKAYEKAIEIFPDPEYVMSLGLFYAYRKDPNAIVMADALLQAPKAAAEKEAFIIKGIYYNLTNQKSNALAVLDKCLEVSYTYMPAYREKAITLYDMAKYEEAVKVLKKAVTLQNNFDEGYYLLGTCYEKLQNNTAAIESYKTALMYDPGYIEAKTALVKLGIK